jgi:hypothetical protein
MNWNQILTRERALHPGMTEADAVKLFYQAMRGGDHLMADTGLYLEGLSREWEGLPGTVDPALPLFQVISPSCDMARFHLAPAKARGISLGAVTELLLAAGLASTPESVVTKALPGFLMAAGALGFREELLKGAFGAGSFRHSPGYGFASYRVITFRNNL